MRITSITCSAHLKLFGDATDTLDGTPVVHDLVTKLCCPQAPGDKVLQKILIDHCEFSRQDSAAVHVRGEGLDRLIVSWLTRGKIWTVTTLIDTTIS